MGFSTHFLGRLDIEPRLNRAEVEWLSAYAQLDRRYFTDPYEVPKDPLSFRVEQERRRDEQRRLSSARTRRRAPAARDPFTTLIPGDGTPYPHLDWMPCPTGCCLTWDSGTEKSRMAEAWLQFLIDHFLRPGAHAAISARPDFADFTFDHELNGVIAAERDDTRELWLIICRDNQVSTRQLVAPDVMPWDVAG